MKIVFKLLFVCLLVTIQIQAVEIELIKSIQLRVPETYTFGTFCQGQGHFFLTDVKNAKVIIFKEDGTVAHEYGEKGLGPKEFLQPLVMDFRNQRMIVGDYMRLGVHVLLLEKEKIRSHEFIKLDYVPRAVCFAGDMIVILGYWSDGQRAWLLRGFNEKANNKSPAPLITQEFVMGISDEENRINGLNYSSLGARNFCASAGRKLFTCWGGRMRVVSLDLKDNKLAEFGDAGKYFVAPKATEAIKKALLSRDFKVRAELTKKMCRIESIAASEHFFYLTYRTPALNKNQMSTILQQYTHDGVFKGEMVLSDYFPALDSEWNYMTVTALDDKRDDQLYVYQGFEDQDGEGTKLVHLVKIK